MTCINDDIIQKYIDGEASPKEVSSIENHIASCNNCVKKIENKRRLSTSLKKAINLLSEGTIEVPEFNIPTKGKRHNLTHQRLYYIIAAACILVFAIVITQKKEMKNDDEIMIEIGSVNDVDANRPVSQFPLVISIIDSKGNISEQIIN